MPRFSMVLDEQLSDLRSNEIAYRIKIENLGTATLDLHRISPRIPEGVRLVEVKDSSSQAIKLKHSQLCDELTELLDQHVFESSKDAREARLMMEKEFFTEVVKEFNSIWRAYLSFFTGKALKRLQERSQQLAAEKFRIMNKADADIALKNWFVAELQNSRFSQLFHAKFEQLVALEKVVGDDVASSALATIEPDSFFATTYVLQFPRSALNPSKYGFSVEAALSETGSDKEFLSTASTTVQISARPWVLSIIAMLSSLLGVAVRFSIDQSAKLPVGSFFMELGRVIGTGQGIAAVVLALALFNIYEFTEFGEKFKMSVGWRSALLIGIIAGLFSERIIAALRTLVGA